jgi:hypothetical protein
METKDNCLNKTNRYALSESFLSGDSGVFYPIPLINFFSKSKYYILYA